MSNAGISFGGLASGLDTQAIIAALLAVEQRPIRALEIKQDSIKKQKSLFGDLGGLLDKLNDKVTALKRTNDFLSMSATSSNEDLLKASASSTATPGSYEVTVDQLAKAQINSAGASSRDSALAGTTSQVTLLLTAGGNTVPISAANNLDAIAAAINDADATLETGVRAEVIDTNGSDPATRYQLVVRSVEPGTENAFSLAYDEGGTGFQTFVDSLTTGPQQQPAKDALVTVNGVQITRSTNTITDLFGGVTLDLKAADPNEEVTITVSTDGEQTSARVKEFVDAYNAVVDFFTTQNALNEEGEAKSPLFGDTTLRSIRSSLRTIVGDSIGATGNESYQLLSQIGISSDTQGKLTFKQSEFEEALADDENAVRTLFTDATGGIASRLESAIDLYTDSVDGLIKTRNEGFDRRIKQTSTRIEQAERRLELYEQRLTQQYANLETLLARLQGQGSSVGNIGRAFGG